MVRTPKPITTKDLICWAYRAKFKSTRAPMPSEPRTQTSDGHAGDYIETILTLGSPSSSTVLSGYGIYRKNNYMVKTLCQSQPRNSSVGHTKGDRLSVETIHMDVTPPSQSQQRT